MWSSLKYVRAISNLRLTHGEFRRLFMSKSFSCDESWTSRLKSPILQKVSCGDLFYDLETKYNQMEKVSAIDVDIFVNAVKNENYLDEMEDLVHKLRMSNESSNMLESTSHGFIRNYLEHGDTNELMRILNDRLNYGVFPDKYCCILLMDHFIESNDFCSAAKVATMLMLQEDFSDDLLKYLSLYSCHKYLLNPTEWEKPEEVTVEEEDEEEIKVRVAYLRNPYFDNHFDLRDPNLLLGKTFLMLCNCTDEPFAANYKLLGLILFHDKNIENYIIDLITKKQSLCLDTIELAEKISATLYKNQNDSDGSSEYVGSLIKNLNILKKENVNTTDSIIELVEQKIKRLVASNEKLLIEEQIQVYEDWENKREERLKIELEALHKRNILKEIDEKKRELKVKEDELFFFEKENQFDLTIENKRVPYPRKWLGKKKKKRPSQEEYIPPEITKQKPKA